MFSGLCNRTDQSHLVVFTIDRSAIGCYDFFRIQQTKLYSQASFADDLLRTKNYISCFQPCNINGFSLVQSEFLQPAQQTKWLLFHLSRLQGKDKNSPIINLTSLYFSSIDIGIHGYFTLKFSYLLQALCLKPFMGPKSVSCTIFFSYICFYCNNQHVNERFLKS